MLAGLKVLEFEGLAPSIFCGMYFADQNATVILIARPQPAPFSMEIDKNIMNRNKKSISLSLKIKHDIKQIKQLIRQSDIVIDPYRPGVLQKEGLGPKDLYEINNKIILLRVSGYGQKTKLALKPGHDLNYISNSGILTLLNENSKESNPLQFPANYVADFVSASLGIVGTLNALNQREKSGFGSVVDCSLSDGCGYLVRQIIQTSLKQENSQKKAKKISYFHCNKRFSTEGKRYIIVQQSHDSFADEQTSLEEISQNIRNMQQGNVPLKYFKGKQYQIAQIVKLQGIKYENIENPFFAAILTGKAKLTNQIPANRDFHRNQILSQFKLDHVSPQPKL